MELLTWDLILPNNKSAACLPPDLPAMRAVLAAREGEVRVLREDSRVKQEELIRALAEIQASASRQLGLVRCGMHRSSPSLP